MKGTVKKKVKNSDSSTTIIKKTGRETIGFLGERKAALLKF